MNISRGLIKRGGAMLMKPLKHNSRMPETSVCSRPNGNNGNGEGSVSQTDQSRCKAMEEEEEKEGEGGEDRMETSLEGCNNSNFDCNICLESSQEPVVTMCGHLFCWACLYKWLNSSPHHADGIQQCPVCKARIKDKIIPLYGRGKAGYASSNTTAPTTTDGCKEGKDGMASTEGVIDIPSRPSAPRIRVSSAHHHHHHHHHHHRAPQHSSSFQTHRQGSRNHGMSFPDAYQTSLGGGNLSFSASFGLFPALFGFQLGGFPEYNHSFSYDGSSSSSSSSSIRALDARANANANAMVFPQRVRWNNSPQELLLHWSFILLVFFVVGCFLFF